jgi:DMSO/TMAO reductase YedYZ molybdopterin-dependent catalytic subunit
LDEEAVVSVSVAALAARFGSAGVTAVVQCGGNRANENIRMRGHSGFTAGPFERIGVGMCGNARWGGIPLGAVLGGLFPELLLPTATSGGDGGGLSDIDARHVEFEGADGYVTSVPLSWVLGGQGGESADANCCLLATHMNGAPLPPDHGLPVRALVPGLAGARSVKWLTAVRVINGESASPWNQGYYKHPAKTGAIIQSPFVGDAVPRASLDASDAQARAAPVAAAAGLVALGHGGVDSTGSRDGGSNGDTDGGSVSCTRLPLNSFILHTAPAEEAASHEQEPMPTGAAVPTVLVHGVAFSSGTPVVSVEVKEWNRPPPLPLSPRVSVYEFELMHTCVWPAGTRSD